MRTKTMENNQYIRLHDQFVPGLYRAAFYLLGNCEAAQQATAEAWTMAYADGSLRGDERLFSAAAEKLLVERCAVSEGETDYYEAATPDGMAHPLLASLASMRFADRALLVLAVVQRRSTHEIAATLEQPQWLVERRLRGEMKKLSMAHKRRADPL